MDFILRMLMGPWTTYILYNLREHGPQRFGELKRSVSGISAKMLTERLRTLEGAALVTRDYEATIPPKVTYSLTKRGGEARWCHGQAGRDRHPLGGRGCRQAHGPRGRAEGSREAGAASGGGVAVSRRARCSQQKRPSANAPPGQETCSTS